MSTMCQLVESLKRKDVPKMVKKIQLETWCRNNEPKEREREKKERFYVY